MNRNAHRLVCLLVGAVAIGCGGGGKLKPGDASAILDGPLAKRDAPDATPPDASRAETADAPPTDAPPTDTTTDTRPTDTPPTDTRPTDATPTDVMSADTGPAPVAGAGSKLVVGGDVQLIGSGADSCSNQVPATTDRWCAFAKPSANLGNFELWVIDVSKVAGGATVKCDTTDANCLRLSADLFADRRTASASRASTETR